ncbi:MAG: hypothetical protein KC441_08405 [Anaerolineales bacterium]|nr:hypothetical protein [Anaerolineales bacterium]
MDKQTLQAQLAAIEKQLADLEPLRSTLSPAQFQATITPLQERKAELEAQLAGTAVSGSGAVAQGGGATAVGERGVNVGGSVGGSIITGDSGRVGGIQAHTIKAENVVQGMQQIGGAAADSADLVELAKALGSGSIKADSIEAQNVVAGLQYIADPSRATPDELRQEIAALQQQLAAAIAAGDFANTGDAEDVQSDLAAAEKELAAPEPQGSRVVRKLKAATEILTESAGTAQAAGKVGIALIKLAPVAAALYQIAAKLFGG